MLSDMATAEEIKAEILQVDARIARVQTESRLRLRNLRAYVRTLIDRVNAESYGPATPAEEDDVA